MDDTLHRLKELIFSSESFKSINRPCPGEKEIQIFGMYGSLLSFFLAYLIEKFDETVLFITTDVAYAEKLHDDLELLLGQGKAGFFPLAESVPYDDREANASLIRLRSEVLNGLTLGRHKAIVAPASALLKKVPTPEFLIEKQIVIHKAVSYSFDSFLEALSGSGYKRGDVVEEVGYYAVRGGIVDIYPWNSDDPIRVEFFGNTIESIRYFNVVSQRSIRDLSQFQIITREDACENSGLFFDYLPEHSVVVVDNKSLVEDTIHAFLEKANVQYQEHLRQNIYPQHPQDRYIGFQDFQDLLALYPVFRRDIIKQNDLKEMRFESMAPPTFAGQFNRLFKYLKKERRDGQKIYVQCESSGQKERFFEILDEEQMAESVVLAVGSVHEGFIFPDAALHLLTEHEIFDRFKRKKTYPAFKSGTYLRSLQALNINDYVVHIDYGVGRYLGLTTIESHNTRRECIKLEYADGDFLFISIDRLNRVQKFTGEEGQQARLTKLGTGEWEKIKKKTRESVQKIAADLVALYAKRKLEQGFAYSTDSHWQKELELSFPYDETDDQIKSIREVKNDLEAPQPMDRLLCGDVGYGKTEVALRAAIKVVLDGKQVVLMVPTTILAYQHYQTFKERMAEFPINVAMLSRFLTPAKQKEILHKLAIGQIDIVIGTHRLLSNDVIFHDLGLLVIDEEQRFGVQHKEKLKKMRTNIDVLSMTATPIPRTLHLSLMGARDLSHIETAPRNRLAVITEVHEWDDRLIKRAIEHELERSGQVYFVHNRVQTIESMGTMIRELVPEARVVVAHGQLPEKKLEKIMLDFIHRKSNVLVATMIIENGLDIPNVNTIIIDHAERFGLAQLYQIRGRVGRSSQQAYAYLLTPHITRLTDLAKMRLRAIQDFTDLGSGLKVALRDMEIRGVGNILGKEQSGNINAIGFDLYCKILNEAIQELDVKQTIDKQLFYADPVFDVDYDLMIPTVYIPDDTERLRIYHRLVNFTTIEEIERMKAECKDRFGALPPTLVYLFDTVELKVLSKRIFAARLSLKQAVFKIHFSKIAQKDTTFFSNIIPKLTSYAQNKIKFSGDKDNLAVSIFLKEPEIGGQINEARNLLQSL